MTDMEITPCPHCRRRPRARKVVLDGRRMWTCCCRQVDCWGSCAPLMTAHLARPSAIKWWNDVAVRQGTRGWPKPLPWMKVKP